jgi:hypothetical protein
MAIPVIGQSDVVNFNQYRYWADRGQIHWENRDTGEYGNQSVRITLHRLRALNDMVKNSLEDVHSSGQKLFYSDEVERHMRWIEEMCELVKKAREQGMPSDASAVRDINRRRKKTVCMPGTNARF